PARGPLFVAMAPSAYLCPGALHLMLAPEPPRERTPNEKEDRPAPPGLRQPVRARIRRRSLGFAVHDPGGRLLGPGEDFRSAGLEQRTTRHRAEPGKRPERLGQEDHARHRILLALQPAPCDGVLLRF